MTGSISVQVFRYRRGLVPESSKTFHFFPRYFLRQGRIFNSKYLHGKVVSKSFKLCFLRTFSVARQKILRTRPCCAGAASHRSLLPIHLPLESDPRRRVFQLKSHRRAKV